MHSWFLKGTTRCLCYAHKVRLDLNMETGQCCHHHWTTPGYSTQTPERDLRIVLRSKRMVSHQLAFFFPFPKGDSPRLSSQAQHPLLPVSVLLGHSSGSQSAVWGPLRAPVTFSVCLQGQNYFHNNTNTFFWCLSLSYSQEYTVKFPGATWRVIWQQTECRSR